MSKRHFEKKSKGGIISGRECIDDTFNPVPSLCEVLAIVRLHPFFITIYQRKNYSFTFLCF